MGKQERLVAARKLQQQQRAAALTRVRMEENAAIRRKLTRVELKWRSDAASRIQASFRGFKARAAMAAERKSRLEISRMLEEQRKAKESEQHAEARMNAKAAILRKLAVMESNRRILAATRIQSWLRGRNARNSVDYKPKRTRARNKQLQELPQKGDEEELWANARKTESAFEGRLEALEAESDALREEFRVLCDVVDERLTTECDALHAKCNEHSEALASWSRCTPPVHVLGDKLNVSDDGFLAECTPPQLNCVKKKKKLKTQKAY